MGHRKWASSKLNVNDCEVITNKWKMGRADLLVLGLGTIRAWASAMHVRWCATTLLADGMHNLQWQWP